MKLATFSTGAGEWVGMGVDPPKFLRGGDVVEVSVTDLGTLHNRVRTASRDGLPLKDENADR